MKVVGRRPVESHNELSWLNLQSHHFPIALAMQLLKLFYYDVNVMNFSHRFYVTYRKVYSFAGAEMFML